MSGIAMTATRHPLRFGMRPRAPKPFLLMIVFGLFLVIVGVTATAQTVLVSLQVSGATLRATVSSDAATVRTFVNGLVEPGDLTGGGSAEHLSAANAGLQSVAQRGEIIRIEIRDPSGIVRISSEPTIVGLPSIVSPLFAKALGGEVQATLIDPAEGSEAVGPPLARTSLVLEYFPLVDADGTTRGVVGIWRDAASILAAVDEARVSVVVVTLSAAAVVGGLLVLVFVAAQRRITRQTRQLVESARQDPLTGLLNHGTVVGELALAIEEVRLDRGLIGVALMDLDNFKGINEMYGHVAGDTALRQLAAIIESRLPDDAIVGRYGPDECLVVARGADATDLRGMVDAIRSDLAAASLDIDADERLPITVSTGIASYPDHADSVTGILSQVAVALDEAKSSGGDATRVADADAETTAEIRSFDVLQGLVFAVDTKDRYTKRHSEDVARYGVFLAGRLGLDRDLIEGIRSAGLLHDVGKVGIPDAILRKPGKLTDDEYEIVKQHVALGDSIVRNVDRIDIVRAGVRHHHERWDGHGYLEALAGEDIPIVARVLAVADAFSAMTTTRPYRKAMSVQEALKRLGDAAGTQLDERLARAFIDGIETAPDAPMPGIEHPTQLWVPRAVTV
ncbi:MAG: diguanylate cyclase [Chloroflexota bacterium]